MSTVSLYRRSHSDIGLGVELGWQIDESVPVLSFKGYRSRFILRSGVLPFDAIQDPWVTGLHADAVVSQVKTTTSEI